jgi:hypothetical protein
MAERKRRTRMLWEERSTPASNMPTRDEPVSVTQVALWLHLCPKTVCRLLNSGQLVGKKVRTHEAQSRESGRSIRGQWSSGRHDVRRTSAGFGGRAAGPRVT